MNPESLSEYDAFGSSPQLYDRTCVFFCGGLWPLSLCWSHTVTAGLNTQKISGAGMSSMSLCQWEMRILIDGAAMCQDGPRLAGGVHYRACDSSTDGEQCVIHIMLHMQSPIMPVN